MAYLNGLQESFRSYTLARAGERTLDPASCLLFRVADAAGLLADPELAGPLTAMAAAFRHGLCAGATPDAHRHRVVNINRVSGLQRRHGCASQMMSPIARCRIARVS